MYYIIDLTTGKYIAKSETQDGILFEYLRIITKTRYRFVLRERQLDFTYLNITGKDIYTAHEPTGKHCWNPVLKYSFPEYHIVRHLRPYQVIDEYGNPQDVRLWKDAVKRINAGIYPPYKKPKQAQPRFRIDPAGYGHRYHGHRVNMRSMMFQQLKLQQDDPMEECDIRPIIDKTAVRKRVSRGDAWDSYEVKHDNKWKSSKSWKDQSKSAHQWSKHKPGSKRRNMRRPNEYPQTVEDIASVCGIPMSYEIQKGA